MKDSKHRFAAVDWELLPFAGQTGLYRLPTWKSQAEKLVGELDQGRNPGIVTRNSVDKLVIGLLAILASGRRTLFLSPNKPQARRRSEFFGQLADSTASSWLAVQSARLPVQWRDFDHSIVFTTPQLFKRAENKGLVSISDFDLLIIDEATRGTIYYYYEHIAACFHQLDLPIMALAKAQAWAVDWLAEHRPGCHVDHWQAIPLAVMPEQQTLLVANPDQILTGLTDKLDSLLERITTEIKSLVCPDYHQLHRLQSIYWTENRLQLASWLSATLGQREIRQQLDIWPSKTTAKAAQARTAKLINRYRLLRIARQHLAGDSPSAFLGYLRGLELTQGKKFAQEQIEAAEYLLENETVIRLCQQIAKLSAWIHPKAEALIRLLRDCQAQEQSCLVFADCPDTLGYLSDILASAGISHAVRANSDGQASHNPTPESFSILLAAPILNEEAVIAEMDRVINYSLPTGQLTRLQKNWRIGACNAKQACYLLMNDPVERTAGYSLLANLGVSKQLAHDRLDHLAGKPVSRKQLINKPAKAPGQLSLF